MFLRVSNYVYAFKFNTFKSDVCWGNIYTECIVMIALKNWYAIQIARDKVKALMDLHKIQLYKCIDPQNFNVWTVFGFFIFWIEKAYMNVFYPFSSMKSQKLYKDPPKHIRVTTWPITSKHGGGVEGGGELRISKRGLQMRGNFKIIFFATAIEIQLVLHVYI